MFDLIRRYRELLAVVVLLVLPLLLFLAASRQPERRNALDRLVLTVFSPVQKAVIWGVEGAVDLWGDYVALTGVREDNLGLRREILRLKGETASLEELRQENARLRRLLEFRGALAVEAVVAPIVSIGASPALHRSVRLGKGTGDGIRSGQPVVTPEGVVGRVVEAGPGWADVMLLADPNSTIPVQVSRTRARATVRGTGSLDEAQLDHALRTDDIREGDVLVTSGTGGIFPKGIPVGRVGPVERRNYGLFQEADIHPAVDLSRVEEVVVLVPRAPEPPPLGLGEVEGGWD